MATLTLNESFTTTLQSEIYTMLASNECRGTNDTTTPYSLSFAHDGEAKNASGYSFGWLQNDLHQQGKDSEAYRIIRDAINNISSETLVSRAQSLGWTDYKDADFIRDSIKNAIVAAQKTSDPFVNTFKDLINPELKKLSDRIDDLTVSGVKQLETHVNDVISKITNPDNKSFVEQSEIAKLIIADIKNQHGNDVNTALQRFLNGEKVNPNPPDPTKPNKPVGVDVQVEGELGIEDLLRFRLSTSYGKKDPGDVLRRVSNTVETLGADNITLTEEDKDFLRNGLKDFNPKLAELLPSILKRGDNVGLRDLMKKAILGSGTSIVDIIKDIMSGKLADAVSKIRSIFNAGKGTESPIILDLDKDGVETTALTSGTYFDLDNNGFSESTGWVNSDDGLLVLDRNNDGQINNGSELFGNNTLLADGTHAANGFQALAELDTNTDGKIDVNDATFSQLKIWSDANGDGEVTYSVDENDQITTDELFTLEELGIQSINTNYTNLNSVDANGNEHKQTGTFTWTDGTTNKAEDVWFKQDKMYTIANDWVEVPDDIETLPDLQGFGNVYDLHQAMARERQEAIGTGQEERLKALIEQFIAATDINTRNVLIDQIIYQWTGVEGIDPTSRGTYIDARQLEALEEMFGEEFGTGQGGTAPGASDYLKSSYDGLKELVYSQLMAQTHLKDLFSTITYTWDEQTQSVKGDLSAAALAIQTAITNDYNTGTILLSEFAKTLRALGAEDMLNITQFAETLALYDPSLQHIIEVAGRTEITGTTANNSLYGIYTSEAIYGKEGNDTIVAGRGDDLLDGGIGNDTLNGGVGSDTYIYKLGDGTDIIYDYQETPENIDIIQFGPGITANDLGYIKEGSNLKITINGQTDTLTIQGWFYGANYKIEQFKFADGTTLTPEDIDQIGYKMYGTSANDSLAGSTANDEISGYEGNDTLTGYEGDDTLTGGAGDDRIYGEAGNDTINGGQGNDIITDTSGSDTYIYNLGDGSDTINDVAGNTDTIQFGEGIAHTDLEYIKENNNLKIKINQTDTITIQNWFYGTNYKIEQFKFADGTTLTPEDIDQVGYKMYGTAANEALSGSTANDEINGYEGNDALTGYEGNDTLIGGSGSDNLNGGAGNDTMDGGTGNDTIVGATGNDTFIYRLGDGTDTISDYDATTGNIDTIEFGEGIAPTDLELIKDGNNLKILINGQTDTVTIQNCFYGSASNPAYAIEQFKFTDGTVLSVADLDAIGYKIYGTTANNSLTGSTANDEIFGYEGNDTLNAYAGADIIDGGTGNDTLNGSTGSDTYKFGIGYGSDIINDYDTTVGNIDTVEFGAGINKNDLQYTKQSSDLKISINGISDTLTIQNYFYQTGSNYYHRIEQFKFADGTVLTSAEIDAIGYKMYGTTVADSLTGSTVNDEINGYEGNDTLAGQGGNDILDGGPGNDNLQGGTGNDTYKYRLGEGSDKIYDYDTTAGNIDTVEFGPGITPNNIEFIKNNSDLKITINGQTDTLTIQSWFSSANPANYRVEQFKFQDGTTLTSADIDAIGYKMYGTTTNDSLTGSNVNDTIYGNAGNDTLYGQTGNDTLNGEAGTDNLQGEAGNDILDGGTGNDTLNGGLGNDTYKFETGSGSDTINDYSTDYATTTDTVEMGANSLNLILTKTSNNLTITNNTNTDQITIQSWYSGAAYQTEEIQTADGKHLHNNQVAQLIQAMATFCTTNGVTWNQAIEQKPAEVQQVLAQYWSQT